MNKFQNISPTNNITWVQGIEGAKAYQLAPSSNIQLMDSENDGIFYIKTSDNIGMCNLRVFKYEEIQNTPTKLPTMDMSEYVRKDELETLLATLLGGNNNEQSIPATERKSDKQSSKTITK